MWIPKGFVRPVPMALLSISSCGLFLGLNAFITCGFFFFFLTDTYIPSVSNFFGSLLYLQLISQVSCITLSRGWSQGPWLCCVLPSLQGFPLKSKWKLPWPHNFCILHACKTIIWMMPRSATTLKSSWVPWTITIGVSGWLSMVKWILGKLLPKWSPCQQGILVALSSTLEAAINDV
jgi:hypothetical protein